MQLASVLMARYFGLVQVTDLNLSGSLYYPEIIAALVDRYGFLKYPTADDVLDQSKGLEFIGGRSGKRVIDKLVILDSGIYLDTSINTAASFAIWSELIEWAVQKFGLSFRPEMVKRAAWVSNVTFHTDVPILSLNPILAEIGGVVTNQVESTYGRRLPYEPAAVSITFDQQSTKIGTAAFTIQRREGVPFEENKYFSTAPLKTEIHLELLEKWESSLTSQIL